MKKSLTEENFFSERVTNSEIRRIMDRKKNLVKGD